MSHKCAWLISSKHMDQICKTWILVIPCNYSGDAKIHSQLPCPHKDIVKSEPSLPDAQGQTQAHIWCSDFPLSVLKVRIYNIGGQHFDIFHCSVSQGSLDNLAWYDACIAGSLWFWMFVSIFDPSHLASKVHLEIKYGVYVWLGPSNRDMLATF